MTNVLIPIAWVLVSLLAACAPPKNALVPVAYEYELNEARRLVEQDRSAEAVEELNLLVPMDPRNAEARFLRGLAYQKLGKFELAAADYRAAVERNPSHLKAYNNLGMILAYKLNDRPGALRAFDRFLTLAPDHEEAFNIAKIMCWLDSPHRNLEASDTETQAYVARARGLSSPKERRAVLMEGAERVADSPVLNFLIGETFMMESVNEPEKAADAIRYFEKALASRPTCGTCHRAMGKLYASLGKSELSRVHLRKADLFEPSR